MNGSLWNWILSLIGGAILTGLTVAANYVAQLGARVGAVEVSLARIETKLEQALSQSCTP